MNTDFAAARARVVNRHRALAERQNAVDPEFYNGVYERFRHPALTAEHVPVEWRFDMNPATNPFFQERMGIGAVFNAGALYRDGKVVVAARVEGADRKSFFALAESETGLDRFVFRPEPILLPDVEDPETNVYDMRLVEHEDGWIYGLFCAERPDPEAPPGDLSSAIATCGVVRSRDLNDWERLPDIISASQQRNVVLHPEFVDGRYALYTRPSDSFISVGGGSGIGWALVEDMTKAEIKDEPVIEPRVYHTIKEVKNGAGATPIKTPAGWLHIAHGVRNTAAGLRYVIYAFMTALEDPGRVIHRPGGALITPRGAERVGDVSNVVFTNGAAVLPDGAVLIYYASSDTRLHVARSSVERLVDYCVNTPPDGGRSRACVEQRLELIRKNRAL